MPRTFGQGQNLTEAGDHEDIITGDPRGLASADPRLPDPATGLQIGRHQSPGLADSDSEAIINNRIAANIRKAGDSIAAPDCAEIIAPDQAPILNPENEQFARGIRNDYRAAADRRAGDTKQRGLFGDAGMGPDSGTILEAEGK